MKENIIPEASYPLKYRKEDSATLSSLINKHESVCLVAMKKVGISNFIRFFFYNPGIKKKYFGNRKNKYLFVYCDLNNLLEISKKSFWMLISRKAKTTGSCPWMKPIQISLAEGEYRAKQRTTGSCPWASIFKRFSERIKDSDFERKMTFSPPVERWVFLPVSSPPMEGRGILRREIKRKFAVEMRSLMPSDRSIKSVTI